VGERLQGAADRGGSEGETGGGGAEGIEEGHGAFTVAGKSV
jgi:hypothetical protein